MFRETFGRLHLDWDQEFAPSRRAIAAKARQVEEDAFEVAEPQDVHDVPTISTLGLVLELLRLPTDVHLIAERK